MQEEQKISELRGDVNYILYNFLDFDLEALKLSNKIMDLLGGSTNE